MPILEIAIFEVKWPVTMKSKIVANRLSKIHNTAIGGQPEAACEELKKFRNEIRSGDYSASVIAEVEDRIDEMEVYVFMSSSDCRVELLEALCKMVNSIDTLQKRKVDTIVLGLEHIKTSASSSFGV